MNRPTFATEAEIRAQGELERARDDARPVPWVVTEGESCLYMIHSGEKLEAILGYEVEGWTPADTWHRAVWLGERLVAVIRPGPDGEPEVIRLDGADPVVIRDP